MYGMIWYTTTVCMIWYTYVWAANESHLTAPHRTAPPGQHNTGEMRAFMASSYPAGTLSVEQLLESLGRFDVRIAAKHLTELARQHGR